MSTRHLTGNAVEPHLRTLRRHTCHCMVYHQMYDAFFKHNHAEYPTRDALCVCLRHAHTHALAYRASVHKPLTALHNTQSLFQWLDLFVYVEALIYQMDEDNEALCSAMTSTVTPSCLPTETQPAGTLWYSVCLCFCVLKYMCCIVYVYFSYATSYPQVVHYVHT